MIAGRLDRRIVIESKTETTDVYGQRTLAWATFLTVWANPVEKDGMEKTDDDNRSTKRMVVFRVRYN